MDCCKETEEMKRQKHVQPENTLLRLPLKTSLRAAVRVLSILRRGNLRALGLQVLKSIFWASHSDYAKITCVLHLPLKNKLG